MPAVLLMHGSGGDKDVNYIHGLSEALVRRGFITLSIDAQYRGDRVRPGRVNDIKPDSFTWRDAWVQTVIDLRRAVDYLETRPDVDKSRIGYLGVSMGGILGGILGGVEERVACFALVVPGGGFVELAKNVDKFPNLKAHWPIKVTPAGAEACGGDRQRRRPDLFRRAHPAAPAADRGRQARRADPSGGLRRVRGRRACRRSDAGASGRVRPCPAHATVFDVRDFLVAHLGKK